jgi:prevent-host-death family protein
MTIETIPAGQFKAKCLKLLDEVSLGHRTLIITKHGKPMVKIVPVTREKKPRKLKAGFLKGVMEIHGDIISPMHDVWNLPE